MGSHLVIPASIRRLFSQPDWYNHVGRVRRSLLLGALATHNVVHIAGLEGGAAVRAKRLMLEMTGQLLAEGGITLGQTGPNWDEERQTVDTVLVHHTASQTPINLDRLNAMHLLRLYVPKYRNPGPDGDLIGGKPIYSGHYDGVGRQVFYGYHWIIRRDGSRERLLPDNAIGWHAGNWDINTRSIGICFDGDFSDEWPTEVALSSAARLIGRGYTAVVPTRILSHRDVVQTECPGRTYQGWGAKLRLLTERNRAA